MNIFQKFFQHNWLAIVYLNFRMLPLRQALRLPIDVYHSVRFDSLDGKITINGNRIYRGMVKIGARGSDIFPRRETVLSVRGEWVVNGHADIGNGTSLIVLPGARLSMGERVTIGYSCKIYCAKEITLGDIIDVSWDSQVFDTNFHEVKNTATGECNNINGTVHVGSHNWIGNRVSIMKGTRTPDYTIVAANSMTNKDYTTLISEHSIIAGSPAKVVRQGFDRVFEDERKYTDQ